MKLDRFQRTRLAVAIGGAVMSLAAGQAFGSAFALQEQNASGLGNAYAGGAAVAEDVSTIWFNPAGLSRIKSMQVVAAGNLICPSAKFNDNGNSRPAMFQTLGGNGGDAGGCAAVPNLYLGVPITDRWSFGLGVNVPFGLKTEYDSNWLGRFQAIESKIETINVNPTLAFAATKELTLGAGVNWQKVDATLTNQVNFAALYAQGIGGLVANGTIPATAAPTLIGAAAGLESGAKIEGNDNAWGWNAGVLWQATPSTRFGASYRSSIKYTVNGTVNFNNPTASQLGALPPTLAPVGALVVNGVNAALVNGNVSLALKTPDSANVSFFSTVNDKWDVMADLQYTGWKSIQQLQIVRSTGVVLNTLPENFRNTWRGSVGANYHYDDRWTIRGGVAYDQSPVNNTDRSPRLPDNNRTWIALGAQYKFNPNWTLDVAYSYIWVQNPDINQNGGNQAGLGLISGSYKSNVNILGAQVAYTFR
ncbi:MAG: outer membrane protein transport protein [Casimicrobiaceae bacterium]